MLNVKLLNKVKKAILEEPKRMSMAKWVTDPNTLPESKRPACNTVGCIAGWAYNIAHKLKPGQLLGTPAMDIESGAMELLGLSCSQATQMFYLVHWPDDWLSKLHRHKPGSKAYAKVVAAYIDAFIKKESANAKT